MYILSIDILDTDVFFVSPLFSPSHFQACGDAKAKPSYLVDKNLESAVKFIVRKFPAVETRNNNVSVFACNSPFVGGTVRTFTDI